MTGALRDRNLLDNTFFLAFLVLVASIAVIALRPRPGVAEIGVMLGVVAVYLMVFLRMASPEERTHVVEYGLLAVLILEALQERSTHGRTVPAPALLAIAAAGALGVVDEVIQLFIPSRVFDPIDIGFNALAALMGVAASLALGRARRWRSGRALPSRSQDRQDPVDM